MAVRSVLLAAVVAALAPTAASAQSGPTPQGYAPYPGGWGQPMPAPVWGWVPHPMPQLQVVIPQPAAPMGYFLQGAPQAFPQPYFQPQPPMMAQPGMGLGMGRGGMPQGMGQPGMGRGGNPAMHFQMMDSDGDGVVSRQEFAAFHSARRAPRAMWQGMGGGTGVQPMLEPDGEPMDGFDSSASGPVDRFGVPSDRHPMFNDQSAGWADDDDDDDDDDRRRGRRDDDNDDRRRGRRADDDDRRRSGWDDLDGMPTLADRDAEIQTAARPQAGSDAGPQSDAAERSGGTVNIPGALYVLDADQDGRISEREVRQFRDDQFRAADLDGNGALSVREFTTAALNEAAQQGAPAPLVTSARAEQVIAEMDTDGSGDVSRREFAAHANQALQAADRNGDGILEPAELPGPDQPGFFSGFGVRLGSL